MEFLNRPKCKGIQHKKSYEGGGGQDMYRKNRGDGKSKEMKLKEERKKEVQKRKKLNGKRMFEKWKS